MATQAQWAQKPDVVLAPDRSLGALVGTTCAFVSLANYDVASRWPGILIDGEGVGRTAAFLLFSLLEIRSLRRRCAPRPSWSRGDGWRSGGRFDADLWPTRS